MKQRVVTIVLSDDVSFNPTFTFAEGDKRFSGFLELCLEHDYMVQISTENVEREESGEGVVGGLIDIDVLDREDNNAVFKDK